MGFRRGLGVGGHPEYELNIQSRFQLVILCCFSDIGLGRQVSPAGSDAWQVIASACLLSRAAVLPLVPRSSSSCAHSALPPRAAECSGVKPSSFEASAPQNPRLYLKDEPLS